MEEFIGYDAHQQFSVFVSVNEKGKAGGAVRVPHERSPEGGNRAQYVIDWNIRLSRLFGLPFGSLGIFVDVLNVNNAGQKFQELDLSGPSFNLRLPAVIQTPRFVSIGFRYDF